jgi:hypothetical protein
MAAQPLLGTVTRRPREPVIWSASPLLAFVAPCFFLPVLPLPSPANDRGSFDRPHRVLDVAHGHVRVPGVQGAHRGGAQPGAAWETTPTSVLIGERENMLSEANRKWAQEHPMFA